MAEAAGSQTLTRPGGVDHTRDERSHADLTLVARDVHVTYTVHEDRRPKLSEVVARHGRRNPPRRIHAVRGVSLDVAEGEAIGLIGLNGSGKSTLLQALAGLLPVESGSVYARSQPQLLGVGAALQRNVSGRHNIELGCLALGLPREEIDHHIEEISEWTGLRDFIDLPLRTYSSGMRSRLQFAIATAVDPDILMIDEALSVGDKEFRKRSQERIEALLARAGSVFLVSHSSKAILETCNRAIWLEQGVVRQDGPVEVVVDAYEHESPELESKEQRRERKREQRREQRRQERRAERRRQRREEVERDREASDGATSEP